MTVTLPIPALSNLLAADDRRPLATRLTREQNLSALAATYAAAVAESAAHSTWEACDSEAPYAEWLADVPQPILATALHLASAAARDNATALREIRTARTLLDTLADHLGH
ncbi:hypothetical protein [Kitasatospora sp. NPDC058478]|uniref:hypothetical protein n=1 Tax=unclassified Kitasatospora TaxID=2633591 RepID=UPI00364D4720